jgi:hypothetical protein
MFPTQGRYGYGVIAWRMAKDEKIIGMMQGLLTSNGVLHFKKAASRLVRVNDAPSRNRMQSGDRIIDVKKDDEILELTVPLDLV